MRTPKKFRGFLALPGEIRNQIYKYYFSPGHRCEVAAKGTQFKQQQQQRKPQTVKLSCGLIPRNLESTNPDSASSTTAPSVTPFSQPLGKYNSIKGLQTNWHSSVCALSLVCKQVYAETITQLYLSTVFIFDAPRRIGNFLAVVSGIHLENITMLHLHYDTYGPPLRTGDLLWQEKHRQSWFRACKALSKNLTGLQELQVWLRLHDSAPKFNLREEWIMPLLQFRRLARAKDVATPKGAPASLPQHHHSSLRKVKVHVETCWSKSPLAAFLNNRKLARASIHLHVLYGEALSLAIKGAREEEAMAAFNAAWEGEHAEWRDHLQFARTGW